MHRHSFFRKSFNRRQTDMFLTSIHLFDWNFFRAAPKVFALRSSIKLARIGYSSQFLIVSHTVFFVSLWIKTLNFFRTKGKCVSPFSLCVAFHCRRSFCAGENAYGITYAARAYRRVNTYFLFVLEKFSRNSRGNYQFYRKGKNTRPVFRKKVEIENRAEGECARAARDKVIN